MATAVSLHLTTLSMCECRPHTDGVYVVAIYNLLLRSCVEVEHRATIGVVFAVPKIPISETKDLREHFMRRQILEFQTYMILRAVRYVPRLKRRFI